MNPKVLITVGVAALLLGLLLGLVPGGPSDVTCGSPWSRNTAMIDAANRGADLGAALANRSESGVDYRAVCDDALDGRGTFGGVLALLGLLAIGGAVVVNGRRNTAHAEG